MRLSNFLEVIKMNIKKVILCLLILGLMSNYSWAENYSFDYKLVKRVNDWKGKYLLRFKTGGKIYNLDTFFYHPEGIKLDFKNKTKKVKGIDINNDGFKDFVITVGNGRGNPDSFFIISGKTNSIIFHHKKCRGFDYEKLITKVCVESRGSRKFFYGKGWIVEEVNYPVFQDGNFIKMRKEKFIYSWNKPKEEFILKE